MKRFALAAGSIVALLMISVPVAFAGPYSADDASAAVSPLVTTNCLDRLNGHSYTCQGKTSFGTEFTETFTFADGVLTIPGAPGAASFSAKCSCGTDGSFTHPLFNHSNTKWQCVGTGGSFAVALEGTVGASGKLSKVIAVSNGPTTAILTCTGP